MLCNFAISQKHCHCSSRLNTRLNLFTCYYIHPFNGLQKVECTLKFSFNTQTHTTHTDLSPWTGKMQSVCSCFVVFCILWCVLAGLYLPFVCLNILCRFPIAVHFTTAPSFRDSGWLAGWLTQTLLGVSLQHTIISNKMRMNTDCCRLIQYLAHVQYLLVWKSVSKVAMVLWMILGLCKWIVSLENM